MKKSKADKQKEALQKSGEDSEQQENKLKQAAQNPEKAKKKNTGKIVKTVLQVLLIITVVFVLLINLFTYMFQIVNYSGTGMEPAIKGGQTLVIRKTQDVEAGDIIAFYFNNQVLVRRVICTGGNQIEIADDGVVSVNGTVKKESYVNHLSRGQCNLTFPYHVRTGTVFVMGDNRETAMDSRLEEIGTIPVDRIIGKVIMVL